MPFECIAVESVLFRAVDDAPAGDESADASYAVLKLGDGAPDAFGPFNVVLAVAAELGVRLCEMISPYRSYILSVKTEMPSILAILPIENTGVSVSVMFSLPASPRI